ncbi:MAG: caspase family protein [Saprospiraceae bacterium]|nr:caspase family protein [Saprospiraceae bacterium]
MKPYFLILFILTNVCSYSQTKGASPQPSPQSGEGRGEVYAVVVGISDYQDPAIPDLRFADKDAEAFANYLRSSAGGKLDNDHLKVLINSNATMAQFANALDWLWEVCKEGDQAIIYFSGHGDVEKKSLTQPGFLLCWDAPARVYMAGGAFALPMLQEVVSTLSIQNKAKVIVITDACRSGTLAGSSVGGSQATAANLAKQFGNEIKIMSCQPNEYSIEGEQWGGGRGAFSYHLLDALYGMADNNNDLWVTLQEVGRYLEDHVTNEVAPVSQVPMVVGNRSEQLTSVDVNLLSSIKSGKTNQTILLSAIDSRGIEEDILSKLDSSTKKMYTQFKNTLKQKIFLEPEGACAESYYQQLINKSELERLHSTMKRNYAAALQEEAQQAINLLLMSDINENLFSNSKMKGLTNATYTKYLERASDLLGPQHYMFKSLKARKAYFEAVALGHFNTSPGNIGISDRKVVLDILNHYREALSWQSDLSFVYLRLGGLYAFSLNQLDSAEYYLNLAMKTTPSWIVPYIILHKIYTARKLEKAREPLEKANRIDSNATYLLYSWGTYYVLNQKPDSAIMKFLKILERDDVKLCRSCIHIALGISYYYLGKFVESEKHYLNALKIDSTSDPAVINLTSLYLNQGRLDESESMGKKWITRYPKDPEAYRFMAMIYIESNRLETADSLCRIALQLDSLDQYTYRTLAQVYLSANRIREAEAILITGIRKDPNAFELMINLGRVYAFTQRIEEATQQFNKAIEVAPNDAETHYQLGVVYNQLKRYEESVKANRLAIQLNPEFSMAYYNLACGLSMLSKTEEAFTQLELAIQKGFNNLDTIEQDSDLQNLKLQKEKWNKLLKKYFPDKMK